MTGLLASVRNLTEARLALAANADIIDLKEPSAGSLGALDTATIEQVVKAIASRSPVSATIGDFPMEPDVIFNKVFSTARTGVDYIKIGLFQDVNTENVVTKLTPISARYKLIAVLFADRLIDSSYLKKLKKAGFIGVMLDTFDKEKGSLTRIMPISVISNFVNGVKNQNMLCGLAGSLSVADISDLLPLQPDYLGFRGALCDHHQRTGQLNGQAIQHIKYTMSLLPY